uniref:beta-1,4-galactosyltransferase 2 n=1 Tax=Ciona intestinalis TaxID=7719 RepID=UPI000052277B|nr:beta-1,4-galactosyltransferase 2 [Ciona intestinalis]|eukprot:XP_002130226.1 beta-1,4-galactosyltransferase 2 [Ciona intestinalis]
MSKEHMDKIPVIPIKAGSLEKNRTSSTVTVFFEGAVRRKTLALVFVFILQVPVLYYLYTTEVSAYVNMKQDIKSTSSVSSISKLCANGTCTNTKNLIKLRKWAQRYPARSSLRHIVDSVELRTTAAPSTTPTPKKDNLSNMTKPEQLQNETISPVEMTTIPSTTTSTVLGSTTTEPTTTTISTTTTTTGATTTTVPDKPAEAGEEAILPDCPETPPDLQGNIDVSFAHTAPEISKLEADNPLVKDGGHYKPPYCKALCKVAIVIPYRDREEHLRYFLEYMHPTLQRQQLDYAIYVVNQAGTGKFNRAKLMNVGYAESIKDHDFQCFAFHDVDLVLENDKSIYSCPSSPRHLSAGVDKFNYQLPYSAIFGGVTELTKEQFQKVNGYSNSFWGWGGEDDDMFNRVKFSGMNIIRYPMDISRYKMITHQREKGNEPNPKRFDQIRRTKDTMANDGLNTLEYKVVSKQKNKLYTNVTVDIMAPAR